jgi:hypothetical protein
MHAKAPYHSDSRENPGSRRRLVRCRACSRSRSHIGRQGPSGRVGLRIGKCTRLASSSAPGIQTIRLIFDQPQRLRCISLVFEENETGRTQEFVLRWSSNGGSSLKEIVREQWNFSPPESIREVEEYQVQLSDVTVLELVIKPNIGGGVARASLKNLGLS